MKLSNKLARLKYHGIVLIIAMIFVVIFTALLAGMAVMSGTNVQIATNQHNANCARICAESGHQIIRSWLNNVSIPGDTAQELRLDEIASSLQSTAYQLSNVTLSYDGSSITIPSINLDSAKGQSFSAVMTQTEPNKIQVDVTGFHGQLSKTIAANYILAEKANTVFNYAVATRGPLSLSGNVELEDVNVSVVSNAYIESENSTLALSIIGNSNIAGKVKIVNPIAGVYLQGANASIGGQTGQAAIDNHVSFGAPTSTFPEPNPSHFRHYAVSVIDSNTDVASDSTFENVRIAAGTNPTFTGNITLKGIVFIEAPNVVTFAGDTTVTGIIVGNGNLGDNSSANQINFSGNVTSFPVATLPAEEQFAQLRNETGTFLIAPGFGASFGGNFNTMSGTIAANGIRFHGNAGGIISGSIINYSDTEAQVTGNSNLRFNRSGTTHVPAGFVPELVLQYDASSYSEGPF
jgi:Tfp pilus assembly protein PilX